MRVLFVGKSKAHNHTTSSKHENKRVGVGSKVDLSGSILWSCENSERATDQSERDALTCEGRVVHV